MGWGGGWGGDCSSLGCKESDTIEQGSTDIIDIHRQKRKDIQMVKEEMNLSLFADEPVNFQRGDCKEIVFYIKE